MTNILTRALVSCAMFTSSWLKLILVQDYCHSHFISLECWNLFFCFYRCCYQSVRYWRIQIPMIRWFLKLLICTRLTGISMRQLQGAGPRSMPWAKNWGCGVRGGGASFLIFFLVFPVSVWMFFPCLFIPKMCPWLKEETKCCFWWMYG